MSAFYFSINKPYSFKVTFKGKVVPVLT